MSFPAFLLPYFIGASPAGFVAFAAKAGVYYLFQRPLDAAKVIALAIVIHVLSYAAGIGIGLLVLPGQGFGWRTLPVVYFLYAAAVSTGCEFLCLLLLRRKLALRRVGASAVAANAAYYLVLATSAAVFFGVEALTRVE